MNKLTRKERRLQYRQENRKWETHLTKEQELSRLWESNKQLLIKWNVAAFPVVFLLMFLYQGVREGSYPQPIIQAAFICWAFAATAHIFYNAIILKRVLDPYITEYDRAKK